MSGWESPPSMADQLREAVHRIAELEAENKRIRVEGGWDSYIDEHERHIAELEESYQALWQTGENMKDRIAELEAEVENLMEARDRNVELEVLLRRWKDGERGQTLVLKTIAALADSVMGSSLDDFNPNADGGAALGERL